MRDTKTGRYELFPDGTILNLMGAPLLGSLTEDGYRIVTLMSHDGTECRWRVHQLVGEAFLGPLEEGQEWRHWDDNKLNNHVENLYKGTRQQNRDYRTRNDRNPNVSGEANANSKLTRARAIEVKHHPLPNRECAELFGLHKDTVYKIRKGILWPDLP